jgi:hypothetical protein
MELWVGSAPSPGLITGRTLARCNAVYRVASLYVPLLGLLARALAHSDRSHVGRTLVPPPAASGHETGLVAGWRQGMEPVTANVTGHGKPSAFSRRTPATLATTHALQQGCRSLYILCLCRSGPATEFAGTELGQVGREERLAHRAGVVHVRGRRQPSQRVEHGLRLRGRPVAPRRHIRRRARVPTLQRNTGG